MDGQKKLQSLALLKKLLPELDDLLEQAKDGHGFLNFSSELADRLIADGLPPWSIFYRNKNTLRALGVRALTDPSYLDELKDSGQVLSSGVLPHFHGRF
jgi:hypothetical protein